ncbi:lipase [Blastopirellula marina]|uniref:Lipase n=1 Tax=Blastopirellula marina TaxID=124 RepID=A0A2S8EZT7_9BACT|nr:MULTISPECIES: SGNH/GDSL hydrolase family protein [Pirellulaceae]PQO25381.1 lipase [Blastopirellula marina]RCS42345.1 SGNH/GDSL hydrolase family protein [Bremerella cremea]
MTDPSNKRKRRRRWFGLIACLLGTLLGVVAGEIALRVYVGMRGWTANCYATGAVFFVPDPVTGKTLRPGLRLKSSTYDIDVNSLGFRGPEIKVAKTPGTQRIVVMGGSSVFGYVVPGKDSASGQLGAILSQQLQQAGCDQPVEVINAGVPSFTLAQCLGRFKTQVAPLKPDIVVLYLGWNDIPLLISEEQDQPLPQAPGWMERTLAHSTLYGVFRYRLFPPPNPQFAPPPSVSTQIVPESAERFRETMTAMIEAIRESGATPVISTQVMAAGSECDSLDKYLGETPEQIAHNAELGKWLTSEIRQRAQKHEVRLIDTAAAVPCSEEVLGDAIHLTAHGHQLVAEAWAAGLTPLLCDANAAKQPEQVEVP